LLRNVEIILGQEGLQVGGAQLASLLRGGFVQTPGAAAHEDVVTTVASVY
jgi:hypothetical protein